jgi:type VI protein secretion system component VasK
MMTSTTVMLVLAIAGASYLLTCWALVDVAVKDFGALEKKAVWGIIAFLPFIGWLIYLLWGRKKGKRLEEKRPVQ